MKNDRSHHIQKTSICACSESSKGSRLGIGKCCAGTWIIAAAIAALMSATGCVCTQKQKAAADREKESMKESIILQNIEIAALNRRISDLEKKISMMKKRSFTLLLTGDILLDNRVMDTIETAGRDYPFKKIAPLLERYDLVFANLETPVTDIKYPADGKPYIFRLVPSCARSLADIKLDVVSLANNHILDQGVEGMRETIVQLGKMGIAHTGSGDNLAQSRVPAEFSFASVDLVFLAYNERPPADFYAGPEKPGTAPLDIRIITEDIRKYKNPDTIVLVSLHWGIEQTSVPRAYQQELARAIIDAGADGIVGHHPHWPQGIEIYRNRPIIYSLGNFVNGFYNEKEKDNIFVVLRYAGGDLGEVEVIPVSGKNSDIQFQPYVLQGKKADSHLRDIQSLCSRLKTRMAIKNGRGYIIPGVDTPQSSQE